MLTLSSQSYLVQRSSTALSIVLILSCRSIPSLSGRLGSGTLSEANILYVCSNFENKEVNEIADAVYRCGSGLVAPMEL